MCGICGVVSLDGDLPPNIAGAVGPMTERLHHRGPDGGAVHHTSWLAFDHRRAGHDHSYALWAVWMLERWARQEKVAG